MSKKNNLIILQTVLPDYRKGFFGEVKKKLGSKFELYAGSSYFNESIKTDKSIEHYTIKNKYLLGRKLLWQKGISKLIKKNEILVLELNPRIISNWWLLVRRKFTGKETVLWGHAWPRKGPKSATDIVRNMMRKLSSSIIVYTNQQQMELKNKMPNKHIVAAPNALFSKAQMSFDINNDPSDILYVGRLVKEKKPLFLAKAFAKTLDNLPAEVNLNIVGDGEEKETIIKYIKNNSLSNRIKLLGHINDYSKLQKLYKHSICSVSPGYVGLSITQSFGFGVPMLISKNENHSPEIEAAVEGLNSVFFDTDDILSFRESLIEMFNNNIEWINKRAAICEYCKQNYSIEAMANVFCKLVSNDG